MIATIEQGHQFADGRAAVNVNAFKALVQFIVLRWVDAHHAAISLGKVGSKRRTRFGLPEIQEVTCDGEIRESDLGTERIVERATRQLAEI